MPSRAQGEPRGYVVLEALVSFLWGFSLKQKKPLDLSLLGECMFISAIILGLIAFGLLVAVTGIG